jgi:hypothetical protein
VGEFFVVARWQRAVEERYCCGDRLRSFGPLRAPFAKALGASGPPDDRFFFGAVREEGFFLGRVGVVTSFGSGGRFRD